MLWRVCSVYAAVFMIYGFIYYVICWLQRKWEMEKLSYSAAVGEGFIPEPRATLTVIKLQPLCPTEHELHVDIEQQLVANRQSGASSRLRSRIQSLLQAIINISADGDPQMAVPLRVMMHVTITCIIYI